MKKQPWCVLIATALLAGCVSTKQRIAPKETVKDYPPVGEEHQAELGDTILDKGSIAKTNESKMWIFAAGMVAGGPPRPTPIFNRTTAYVQGQRSFRQELIYNGKSGNQVKFMYREFSGDMIRSAFNQQVEYDLSESKEIGFKGARIELIEASNTQIKYKVLKSFPDAH